MKLCFVLLFLKLSVLASGQDCKMLQNGTYELQWSGSEDKFLIEINDNQYFSLDNNQKKSFTIKALNACTFELEKNENDDASELTEFQKILSKQGFYIQITHVEGNCYHFICHVNLHIQCGSGRYLKLEN
jgi:uncharacterized protein YcgL (UPF0745 family)